MRGMDNTHTATALIRDAAALEALHDTIEALIANIDDDALVPERYMDSLAAHLSESDAAALARAARITFRLGLWARYPNVSGDSYVAPAGDHSVRA